MKRHLKSQFAVVATITLTMIMMSTMSVEAVPRPHGVVGHTALRAKGVVATVVNHGTIYVHNYPKSVEHDQSGGCTACLVTGPYRARARMRASTLQGSLSGGLRHGVMRSRAVSVLTNTAQVGPTTNSPPDTSEASYSNVVVYVANDTIMLSTDWGTTFTAFPSGAKSA